MVNAVYYGLIHTAVNESTASLLSAALLAMACTVRRRVCVQRVGVRMGKGCEARTNPCRNGDRERTTRITATYLASTDFRFLCPHSVFTVHEARWLSWAVPHKARDKSLAASRL